MHLQEESAGSSRAAADVLAPWSRAARRWEAILLVLDGQPFQELAGIVQQLDDERVWTFAEWIGIKFAPRTQGYWTPGESLIQACAAERRRTNAA